MLIAYAILRLSLAQKKPVNKHLQIPLQCLWPKLAEPNQSDGPSSLIGGRNQVSSLRMARRSFFQSKKELDIGGQHCHASKALSTEIVPFSLPQLHCEHMERDRKTADLIWSDGWSFWVRILAGDCCWLHDVRSSYCICYTTIITTQFYAFACANKRL